ncbi:MAG: hypothetical protein RLZZ67_469 [Candidatus Parcubacteria bacterium]|jgi:hypothetical protein
MYTQKGTHLTFVITDLLRWPSSARDKASHIADEFSNGLWGDIPSEAIEKNNTLLAEKKSGSYVYAIILDFVIAGCLTAGPDNIMNVVNPQVYTLAEAKRKFMLAPLFKEIAAVA